MYLWYSGQEHVPLTLLKCLLESQIQPVFPEFDISFVLHFLHALSKLSTSVYSLFGQVTHSPTCLFPLGAMYFVPAGHTQVPLLCFIKGSLQLQLDLLVSAIAFSGQRVHVVAKP